MKNTVFQARGCLEASGAIAREEDIVLVFFRSTLKEEPMVQLQKDIRGLSLTFRPIFVAALHSNHNMSDYISPQLNGGVEGQPEEKQAT